MIFFSASLSFFISLHAFLSLFFFLHTFLSPSHLPSLVFFIPFLCPHHNLHFPYLPSYLPFLLHPSSPTYSHFTYPYPYLYPCSLISGYRSPNGVRSPHPHHWRCRTRIPQRALLHMDRSYRCLTCQPGSSIQECRLEGP